MASRQPDVPAIEHDSGGLLGKMSLPIGMHRRAFSYDDALEDTAPMTPPPSDMCSNILWRKPVIPERKYQKLSKVEEGDTIPPMPPSSSTEKVPVVKAKATSVIMNSLMTKHTQESIQRFEQQAGLRDAGYTPHKGLTAEETKYHRVAEALHKLKMQTGDASEEKEKQSSSAQSTPCSTPGSSPKQMRRSWFGQGSTTSLPSVDFSNSETGGSDKWSVFGPRTVQKSTTDPGGFSVQSYKGAQKPSPMELMRSQAARNTDDNATFKPPKMEMPSMVSGKKKMPSGHNLKPRDMNILTPTGF